MLSLKLHFHAYCPKHVGYRPEEGRGAIKGGCDFCEALYCVWQAGRRFSEAVERFQDLKYRYETKQLSRAPVVQTEGYQDTLFSMEVRRK